MPPSSQPDTNAGSTSRSTFDGDDAIDLRELFGRLWRGLAQVLGLTALGLALGATVHFFYAQSSSLTTSTRVVFSFPGFEKGLYPDQSKFQPDDLRAPTVVAEALKLQGLDMPEALKRLGFGTSNAIQGTIRGALSIEGIVPANVTKERDRLRAAGQTPTPYIPDEYTVTLTLPRTFALGIAERGNLLREIVSVYRKNFQRTYADVPLAFGNAFETLKDADFPEYELILTQETQKITAYLEQQLEQAKSFRSTTTNLSFKELLEKTQLFAQLRLNEALGIIHQNGLSRDRRIAMTKMDYYLVQLEDRQRRAEEEEKVVTQLLEQSRSSTQNYVLGIKSQASQPRTDAPILDQGVIDSLLANDTNGLLVRRALDAGLQVKRIQADKNEVAARRKSMEAFIQKDPGDQSAIVAQVGKSLKELEGAYKQLVDDIRKTHADFAGQQFGDAIRLSDQATTPGTTRPLVMASTVGGLIGAAFGIGLSLLGIYVGRKAA